MSREASVDGGGNEASSSSRRVTFQTPFAETGLRTAEKQSAQSVSEGAVDKVKGDELEAGSGSRARHFPLVMHTPSGLRDAAYAHIIMCRKLVQIKNLQL